MEGDPVFDEKNQKRGMVEKTSNHHVEVKFENEGLRPVSWRHLTKLFSAGELVVVTGGVLAGQRGWVVSVKDHIATLLCKEEDLTPGEVQQTPSVSIVFNDHATGKKRNKTWPYILTGKTGPCQHAQTWDVVLQKYH